MRQVLLRNKDAIKVMSEWLPEKLAKRAEKLGKKAAMLAESMYNLSLS
jgi:hypothetical protein